MSDVGVANCTINFRRTEHLVKDADQYVLARDDPTTICHPFKEFFARNFLNLIHVVGAHGVCGNFKAVQGQKDDTVLISTDNLAVLAKRLHAFLNYGFEAYTGTHASCTVNIQYSCSVGITFNTRMATDDRHPARFDAANVRSLVRLAGLDLDYAPELSTARSPSREPEAYDESTDITGDFGRTQNSGVAMSSASTPEPSPSQL